MATESQRCIQKKIKVLNYAKDLHNVSKACRYFGISRETFYQWKKAFDKYGEEGLINKKPGFRPGTCPWRTSKDIEDKILHLRTTYHFGPQRISWHLERYLAIKITAAAVYYVLKRNRMNKLPENQRKRSIPSSFIRYEKKVPGHHVQIDVKFLFFYNQQGKRFQYTAIDDASRIRALKIYQKHTQQSAIDFVSYVINKFPFRIHTIRTDNGHEFQAKFHWHIEDQGIHHTYIKPGTPRLNGKVERSHLTDKSEFYQLLEYKNDVDLDKKLSEWENYYNMYRPHGGLLGKTPYEVLKIKLQSQPKVKNVKRGH
ncbi:IS481 family transposase [Leptospira sp. WS92.C1]